MRRKPVKQESPEVGDVVVTCIGPEGWMGQAEIIHTFTWCGTEYFVVCTRDDPPPPILGIRELEQMEF